MSGIHCGANYSVALDESRRCLWGWGTSFDYQLALGDGRRLLYREPHRIVQVPESLCIASYSAGNSHSLMYVAPSTK